MAARYLRVPPWELARQPSFWRDAALAAMSAEQRASRNIQRIEERRAKRRS